MQGSRHRWRATEVRLAARSQSLARPFFGANLDRKAGFVGACPTSAPLPRVRGNGAQNLDDRGSNHVPERLTTFCMASSSGKALRYWRWEARASRQSTAESTRAPRGISSRFSPSG